MNHANRTADDVNNTKPYLELVATTVDTDSLHAAVARSDYPLSTADCAENDPFFQAKAGWQVREDQNDQRFYVPDLLSDKNHDIDRQAYADAGEHAAHLRKAERLVCQAEDLVGSMRAAISYENDARAMRADTELTAIEKKLCKAHSCINKHDRRHSNLFLAYFDLRNKTGHGVE